MTILQENNGRSNFFRKVLGVAVALSIFIGAGCGKKNTASENKNAPQARISGTDSVQKKEGAKGEKVNPQNISSPQKLSVVAGFSSTTTDSPNNTAGSKKDGGAINIFNSALPTSFSGNATLNIPTGQNERLEVPPSQGGGVEFAYKSNPNSIETVPLANTPSPQALVVSPPKSPGSIIGLPLTINSNALNLPTPQAAPNPLAPVITSNPNVAVSNPTSVVPLNNPDLNIPIRTLAIPEAPLSSAKIIPPTPPSVGSVVSPILPVGVGAVIPSSSPNNVVAFQQPVEGVKEVKVITTPPAVMTNGGNPVVEVLSVTNGSTSDSKSGGGTPATSSEKTTSPTGSSSLGGKTALVNPQYGTVQGVGVSPAGVSGATDGSLRNIGSGTVIAFNTSGSGGILGSASPSTTMGDEEIPYFLSFAPDQNLKDDVVTLPSAYADGVKKFPLASLREFFNNPQTGKNDYRPLSTGNVFLIYFEKAPYPNFETKKDQNNQNFTYELSLSPTQMQANGFGPGRVWRYKVASPSTDESKVNLTLAEPALKKGLFVVALYDPTMTFIGDGTAEWDAKMAEKKTQCLKAFEKEASSEDQSFELAVEDLDCTHYVTQFVRAIAFMDPPPPPPPSTPTGQLILAPLNLENLTLDKISIKKFLPF